MPRKEPKPQGYEKDRYSGAHALRTAHEISFAPVVFQVSRLMLKYGIFQQLSQNPQGLSRQEIATRAGLTDYAAKILLEASLTIGSVLLQQDKYRLAKVGWFLLNDPLVKVNMDFIADVNYLGLDRLDASLQEGRPAGLEVFGTWPTIYEGLSQLPEPAKTSWFAFDHYYSDHAFDSALNLIFAQGQAPRRLLDVGGNTGRWACRCIAHDPQVEVTIMDLPQQLGLMRKAVAQVPGAERIHGHPANVLDPATAFPTGFDAIFMSQFLDCFSMEEITGILSRAARSMDPHCRLYIMETLWDLQDYEPAAFCLTQISVYFTVMANGNSKMYHSADLIHCVEAAGLRVTRTHTGLPNGHCLLECRLPQED